MPSPEQRSIAYPSEFEQSPYKKESEAILGAARGGNVILRDWFERAKRGEDIGAVEKSFHFKEIGFSDVMTLADKDCEAAVIARLKQCSDLPICAEESGESVSGKDLPEGSRRWLIDPLDGTFNFKNGREIFSITIALQEKRDGKWETLVGAVSIPMSDEIYIAGESASYRIHDGKSQELQMQGKEAEAFSSNIDGILGGKKIESVVYCIAPEKKQRWLTLREKMFERMGEAATDSFSSAMMIAGMAANKRDAVILGGSALDYDWDTKAALHIAEKAGAKFKQIEIDGEPCLIVANSNSLANALEQIVQQEYAKLAELGR